MKTQKQPTTWDKVMSMKANDTRHKGVANTLTVDELDTILGTADYFGADCRLIAFDLQVARYRVFDWLAMAVQGRIENQSAVKVLVYSFLKVNGNIDEWIRDLRKTDYDIVNDWQEIELSV